jgi:hypothetical protein
VGDRLARFNEFRDNWLETAPAGYSAFHAQLYPGIYPGDAEIRKDLQARGRPLSELVSKEYLDFVVRVVQRGVTLRRLVIVPGAPGSVDYSPQRIAERKEIFAPIQTAGEEVRLAYFGVQSVALMRRLGLESPLVARYLQGAFAHNPKASFWSLRDGQDSLRAVWVMNYEQGTFQGGPLHQPPFSPEARDVLGYEDFWHGVFADEAQSFPLQEHPTA